MSGSNEKIPVEEVKFLPNGAEEPPLKPDGDIEKGKPKEVDEDAFVGLSKEELQQFADDPFWVRTRRILFILFWVLWIGMIAAAVIIIVLTPKCPARPDQKWWETSVVYTVDVRTFKDSDGDGVGDLSGLTEKLGYLVDIVGTGGAIALRSIFQTSRQDPLRRDVVDFKAVDGEIGNAESLKLLVKSAHKKGVKVILEIDLNHSGKEHQFFKDSQANTAGYKDFYVWTNNPNGWKTLDGSGDAWTNDPTRGEFYYAVNGPDFPDFNLKNEAVMSEVLSTLKYWLMEEGIDGFIISKPELFVEGADSDLAGFSHQPESAEIVHAMRAAFDEVASDTGKDRALIVRIGADGNATQRSVFYGSADVAGANLVLNSQIMERLKDAGCKAAMGKCLVKVVEDTTTIVEESHQPKFNNDRPWFTWALSAVEGGRIGSAVDEAFIDALNLLLLTLKGTPVVLYGDELGMKDGTNVQLKATSVMQWDSNASGGFTSGQSKYPVNGDIATVNVKFQEAKGQDASHINAFKAVVALRSSNSFVYGDLEHLASDDGGLLSFVRNAKGHPAFYIAVNLGQQPAIVPGKNLATAGELPSAASVVFATPGSHDDFKVGTELNLSTDHLLLQSGDGVIIKLGRQ